LERRISKKLFDIPGYRGYRSLEDRRDDDRRVRDAIASALGNTSSTLTRLGARLAEERKLQQISGVERLVGNTRHLADRVRTASYGYGGLFTQQPVGAIALDQLKQFDVAFQNEVATLDEIAERLSSSPEGPLPVDIAAYSDELVRLNRLFDARTQVVESAQPSQDAEVLSLLEPPAAPVVSPVSSLNLGDAFSVLGDDFIVDAVVILREPERTVQIVRAGNDPDGQAIWFVGGTTGDVPSARLSEAERGTVNVASGRNAEMTITTRDGANESVPAQYAYTASTGDAVTFWYSVGNETRSFAGTSIVDADIQVYGQA
jgi:hypothetical protein